LTYCKEGYGVVSNAATDKYVVCEIYVVYMNEEVENFFAW